MPASIGGGGGGGGSGGGGVSTAHTALLGVAGARLGIIMLDTAAEAPPYATSALTLGQQATVAIKRLDQVLATGVTLGHHAVVHTVHWATATSAVAIETAIALVLTATATTALTFADTATGQASKACGSVLEVSQAASVRQVRSCQATSSLALAENALTAQLGPVAAAAGSELVLGHAAVICQQHRSLSAADVLQEYRPYFDNTAGALVDAYVGLDDLAVAVNAHGPVRATSRLTLGDSNQHGVLHADAIAAGATDVLSLAQRANQAPTPTDVDALRLGDLAEVTVGKQPIRDSLALGHHASVVIVRVLSATDTLTIGQAFVYDLPTEQVEWLYQPSIGQTLPGSPPPPPGKLVYAPDNDFPPTTLLYPPVSPTDTLTLRSPELGNKDRLQFNRVSRETRGGTLVVYADPMWPKVQVQVLSFTGLTRDQAQHLLSFMSSHLGLEIGFIDWEQRLWTGVITNPNDAVTQDGRGAMYSASLEFEGALA
jgi:hypothetical protein